MITALSSDSAVMPLSQHRFRLLVLADAELDCQWLEATLRRNGVVVDLQRIASASALQTALDESTPDGIIACHPLARMDAGEALERIRARDRVLPFIFIADSLDEDTVGAALRNGASDFLARNHLARLAPAVLNAVSLARARHERQAAVVALEQSEQRLRELYGHLESAIEHERTAIAREIHDDIGNLLTTLRFDLLRIERDGEAATSARAGHALQTVARVMESAQRIQRGLRPPILDAGLVAALEWQIGEFRRSTGVAVVFSHHGAGDEPDGEQAMVLYRTLQEALTNIARHARARTVRVDLVVDERQASLEITDDGIGLTASALDKPASFGLRGLRERALLAGGWLDVSNRAAAGLDGAAPGAHATTATGTCILLSLPRGAAPARAAPSTQPARSTRWDQPARPAQPAEPVS